MREFFWGFYDVWEVVKDMIWQISIVILIVMACRLFVGKISKQASYLLWLIVAVRLLCPVMIPSDFSVFNVLGENRFTEMEIASSGITSSASVSIIDKYITSELPMQDFANAGQAPVADAEDTVGNFTQGTVKPVIPNDNHNNIIYSDILKANFDFIVWLAGMTFMFAYGFLSYYRLKYKLRFATKAGDGVFESNAISSPFVFGVIKPVIYLPYHLNGQEKSYILQHEKYHIKRRDYLVKLFAFGLLAVYWFHPLVWTAFYLMSRDMEMSCDEQVLKELGMEERKAYSTLLLSFAGSKRFPLPSPLSFGENDTRSRIRQILNYKKPTFWGIAAVIVLIIVMAVCCLTDAKDDLDADDSTENIESSSEMTDEEILAFAKALYEAKAPYIGDINSYRMLLIQLRNYYDISGMNGSELQTYTEPYWITVGFDEKPDDTAMWKLASVFLALVDNCSEFRWEFTAENDNLYTYYVRTEDVEEILGCENLKEYSSSTEKIAELLVLLNEKATDTTEPVTNTDYSINANVSFSLLQNFAEETEISWNVLNQYETRLIADGAGYRGNDYTVYNCFYQDFDNSGTMDFILHVKDTDFDNDIESILYIYMNDDPLYTEFLPGRCWYVDIISGDIDHDGNTELIYKGDLGGNGGSGAYCKGILKYENHTLAPMEMPGDFTGEEAEWGDAGYRINVYFGKDKDTYEVVCPAIGEYEVINSEYLKREDGSYFVQPNPGERAGANCRGFYSLDVIRENGQDYLMAEEYFHGEGGVNHGLGYARFIFDWSDSEGWIVKDATIHAYSNSTSSETDIFEEMKAKIAYYPDDYEELINNWDDIPVINYMDGTIFDQYNRFTKFAQTVSQNLSSDTIIYAKLDERKELTYVYIKYQDNRYYYLEDYTRVSQKPYLAYGEEYIQKIYTNELYTTMEYASGNIFEKFYLTNEENLTEEDIFESLLSSQYPPELDYVTVYSKELDEEGLENSSMNEVY